MKPIIYTGSHCQNSINNREAFSKINDLLLDKKNPYYDIFNEEKLFLDDTNGFLSIIQSSGLYNFSEKICEGIYEYILENVGFDGETFVYIGDGYIRKVNYNL